MPAKVPPFPKASPYCTGVPRVAALHPCAVRAWACDRRLWTHLSTAKTRPASSPTAASSTARGSAGSPRASTSRWPGARGAAGSTTAASSSRCSTRASNPRRAHDPLHLTRAHDPLHLTRAHDPLHLRRADVIPLTAARRVRAAAAADRDAPRRSHAASSAARRPRFPRRSTSVSPSVPSNASSLVLPWRDEFLRGYVSEVLHHVGSTRCLL